MATRRRASRHAPAAAPAATPVSGLEPAGGRGGPRRRSSRPSTVSSAVAAGAGASSSDRRSRHRRRASALGSATARAADPHSTGRASAATLPRPANRAATPTRRRRASSNKSRTGSAAGDAGSRRGPSRRASRSKRAEPVDDIQILQCQHLEAHGTTLVTDRARAAILDPLLWQCADCGTTDGIWACLRCGHMGCGRDNEQHARQHHSETGHPLVLEITSKYVHCYLCDNYVMNDSTFKDLAQLRADLESTERHADVSRTRSGRALRASAAEDPTDQRLEVWGRAQEQDRRDTALRHWRFGELGKAFNTWRFFVLERRRQRRRTSEPPVRPATPAATAAPTPTPATPCRPASPQASLASVPATPHAGAAAPVEIPEPATPMDEAVEMERYEAVELATNRKRKRKAITPGMTGLRNLGQTCFMNVVLQAFSHMNIIRVPLCEAGRLGLLQPSADGAPASGSPQLRSAAHSRLVARLSSDSKSCGGSGVKGGGGAPVPLRAVLNRQTTVECHSRLEEMAAALAVARRRKVNITDADRQAAEALLNSEVSLCPDLESLFRVMWSGKWSVVTPRAILAGVWKLIPSFRGYKQQDAQELLIEFQERLVVELKALQTASEQLAAPLSLLLDVFDGELRSEVKCRSCDHLSCTPEAFCEISLDFPQALPRHLHLRDMLDLYTKPETFGEAIYRCDGCSLPKKGRRKLQQQQEVEYRDATKTVRIGRLPGVLNLHLKRFRWSGIRREKIQVPVTVPLVLDMRPYCTEDAVLAGCGGLPGCDLGKEAFVYDLAAVVVHDGRGINSGHYRCYCYNTTSSAWIHCNDARVSEVDLDVVCGAQAYILFYSHRLTEAKRLPNGTDAHNWLAPRKRANHSS